MTEQTQNIAETHEYQAEMKQLLNILIHSLYTDREVFLRELVSNSSDAMSKYQFLALTSTDAIDKEAPLEITITHDEKENSITIEDSGIGMNKEELIKNIGTIANSGTLNFLKEANAGDQKPQNLIGQFGVGFYAVFMVAQKVVVSTRSWKQNEQGWEWSSDGSGQYQLRAIEKNTRGTSITVFLKEDAKEFCSKYKLESIIKKYSNYISFPIKVDGNTANKVLALWTQPKSSVKTEDYEAFYKELTFDNKTPLLNLHLSVDAPIQYSTLLYIPSEITNDILYSREGKGLNLYAQRVLIQHDNHHLLPAYLRFVRGVVDSEDLPLNVSRENIQKNALLDKIKKSLTTRLLKELQELSQSNSEKYNDFWKQYGVLIKEGITSDFANKDKLVELLRFNSSVQDDNSVTVSLKDYVGRMRDDQKEIYFGIGPSRESIMHNPNLEYFKKHNLEVLFLYDHIDDFLMSDLREYEGKKFKSISQKDIETVDSDKNADQLSKDDTKTLIEFIKKQLAERVADVIESKRLVESPCSLISQGESMSSHMEKMMKMVNKEFQMSKKTIEINTSHPIIKNLSELIKKDAESFFLKEIVEQLFSNALLIEGLLDDPLEGLPRIYRFMEAASAHQLSKS
ncbi:MAG: molecular chaperone HtpG [SAR324 cluster bacterium]|nr:molecular chaperone HtpG [SAR324 cluster bacterium]